MIYLLTYLCSAGILAYTERQQKSVRTVGAVLALALPVLLATMRADTVGIDVGTYMKPLYLCSMRSEGLKDFFDNMAVDASLMYMDYGYAVICYFVCKLTGGLWGIFLANALLCFVPFWFALKNLNRYLERRGYDFSIPAWAALFIFECLFYNNSLNQTRQIIDCCLLLCAVSLVLKRRYFTALLLFVVACTIHVSAFLFLYFLVLWWLAKGNRVLRYLLVAALVVFALFSIQIFYLGMKVLDFFGLVPEKYFGEIFETEYGERNINLSWLFIGIFMLAVSGIYAYRFRKDPWGRFLLLVTVSYLSLFNLSSYFSSFGRVQLYFMIYACYIFPMAAPACKGLIAERRTVSVMVCTVVPLLFWIVAGYFLDYTGTIPYRFAF